MRTHATGKKYKEMLAYDMEKIAVDFEDVSRYDEDYEADTSVNEETGEVID